VIPQPIAAYLARALPAGRPVPRQVRIAQEGRMWKERAAAPRRFSAVQHIAVDSVAFAWRARFPIVPGLAIKVVDAYAAGAGSLDVRLLGRTLQREQGPETAVGEALRYLAELPWAPYAMQHNSELAWRDLDGGRVEVTTRVGPETVVIVLEFDGAGDIVRASSAVRPFLTGGTSTPTPWAGEFSDFQELGGMRMPTRAEVYWELPEGRFVYWRGQVVSALGLDTPFEPAASGLLQPALDHHRRVP
jgi:hypothetical protein